MTLSDIAIRRPVFTSMVMFALMVLGVVSFGRLGVDLFPDISFPLITVTTVYPGAGPEEVEQLVTKPIEDSVISLAGVDTVRSMSREGLSSVIVTFKIGTDVKMASVDVRDRVTAAHRMMPTEVTESTYLRLDPSATPVQTLVLSGDADGRTMRSLADDMVKPILERGDGVAAVLARGGEEREIEVEVSAEALARYGLTLMNVSQALGMENANIPTGRLDQGTQETSLRLEGQVAKVGDLSKLVVATVGGTSVTVGDVAGVKDGAKDRRTLVRVDGREAVALDVMKQSGGNTVAVARGLLKPLQEARAALPPGVKLDTVIDSSVFIQDNAADVEQQLVLGGIAAISVIFLFMLDWRSTFISAIALPTSIITTFFGMYLLGFSLNMMSLMGLSLSVGFLIDDAIVVRENIFRHIEAGEDPITAASKGTSEIALAVFATTASILAVFIPVAFTGGLIGQMFRQFALTVALAVSVSLFVAFTVDPMLSARLVKPRAHGEVHTGVAGAIRRVLDAMDEGYRGLLGWALHNRWKVLISATMVFFMSLGAVGLMGTEFFPKPDRGQFMVNVVLPPGTSLSHTAEVVGDLEGILHADPDVVSVYTVVGPSEEARKAAMRVTAVDKQERARSLPELMQDLRKKFAAVPGLRISFSEAGLIEGDSDFRQAPITINVRGPDLVTLAGLADKVGAIVAATPGITDQDTSYAPGQPELAVHMNRDRAATVGVTAAGAGMALRSAMVGDTPTRFHEGERDYDVRVRLRAEDRSDPDVLGGLLLPSRSGLLPLREVADLTRSTGPSTIEREDRQRQITVIASTLGRSLGEVVDEIQAKVDKMARPPGYTVAFSGEAERMRESANALGVALLLAIVFIYVVLASQFESFLHPITIMVSLPLAIVGAFLGLFLTGKALGMSAFIGVILLMGLVTKNAILLVDRANQVREHRGLSAIDALLEAGPTRLRPIVMTSATIVLGSLPTALSNGPGSEFRSPMSIAVIGGVITSTVLTLVVVPVVYTFLDRFTSKGREERARLRAAEDDATAEVLEGSVAGR